MSRIRSKPALWTLGLVATAALAAPQAVLVEPVHDAGTVARGAKVEHVFIIRNEGDTDLELVEVKPTCGCTVADYDRMIQPGREGRVRAEVDTTRFRGPIAKTVRVFTNDGGNPELQLVVKANVRSIVESEPGYARFLTVLGEGAEPVRQLVWQETEGELVIEGVSSPYPFVDVAFREAAEGERKSGRPGRQWVLDLRLAENAPPGPLADYVTLRTNNPRQRELKIPVSGYVRPAVAVVPAALDFGRKDLAEPRSAVLEVTHHGQGALSLGAVTSDLAGLSARVEPIREGRRYKLTVTLAEDLPAGPFTGKLTIATSSRVQPVVEVEVRGVSI